MAQALTTPTSRDVSGAAPYYDCLRSVEQQEIELGTMDLASFGINLDGVYLYRNADADADPRQFMALDRIARGFCRVVAEHYPIV
ncbi:hypothetical protein LPJ61_004239, partial [Coemansia biformis]